MFISMTIWDYRLVIMCNILEHSFDNLSNLIDLDKGYVLTWCPLYSATTWKQYRLLGPCSKIARHETIRTFNAKVIVKLATPTGGKVLN